MPDLTEKIFGPANGPRTVEQETARRARHAIALMLRMPPRKIRVYTNDDPRVGTYENLPCVACGDTGLRPSSRICNTVEPCDCERGTGKKNILASYAKHGQRAYYDRKLRQGPKACPMCRGTRHVAGEACPACE